MFLIRLVNVEKVSSTVHTVNSLSQFNRKVEIEGKTVKDLIDTGSSLNILNQKTVNEINKHSGGKLSCQCNHVR